MSRSASKVTVVKLGGSLITDKATRRSVREETLARLAGEVAEALPELRRRGTQVLLSHGSGSYGHMAAHSVGYEKGRVMTGGAGVVQRAAAELHGRVLDALLSRDVPCFSFAPSSAFVAEGGTARSIELRPLLMALEAQQVPVTYGDVVLDEHSGWTILSTEEVVTALVSAITSERATPVEVLWMGDVDGILDGGGEAVPVVDDRNAEAVAAGLGSASGTDVTGGIKLRFETARRLAARGVPSHLLDGTRPGLLREALHGAAVGGTRFVNAKGAS